jgi:CelD/BcsL family acetyltransferase involved in cellulose biosynthesis
MRSELIIGDSAFTQLAGEWDALVAGGMTNTPFQTLTYQRAWWTHLQPDGATLVTAATRDEERRLIGIACFFLLDDCLHFNGCVEETDYLDLIAPAEQGEAVWRATWECLTALDEPAWRCMDLCNVPAASPTRVILPALALESNYQFSETVSEVCPVITLSETFEAYLETLDSKQRRELSRKLRRAEAADVVTTTVGPDANLAEEVDSFLELLQKSTFEKRDWLNDGRRALFHEVARAAQAAGTLQLMFTAVEERRAAALFNFDHNGRIWVYNSGLDPNAFAALSPGQVLTASAIEQAIRLGRREFDFMRGDEEYKYRFGAQDTQIFRLRVEREAA